MSMVCPRCNTTFEERYHCPSCGIPLVAAGEGSGIYSRPKWQQTVWGRLVVGLLLAQGLYYGFWQLSTAAVLALVEESARGHWWDTTTGMVLLHVMLAVSVFGGGMMAGAGQKHGALYGALLGLVNGLIFLAVPRGTSRPVPPLELFGQPLLQVVCGMVGAWVGSRIWKPALPIVPVPAPLGNTPFPIRPLDLQPAAPKEAFLGGPVSWVRVIAGTFLAILGSSWANLILRWVLESGMGFNLESQYHARFVTWEISVLALVLGAGLAGSNSRNGLKHGLLVGVAVLAGLLGIYAQVGTVPPPTLIFELLWNVKLKAATLVQTAGFTGAVILPVALAGGWFGSQLLPPVSRFRKKDRYPVGV